MLEPPRRSPLDFALASAASPGGFAPELLDRRPDADTYERHGIENFPESGHLWYTDGGLLGSQPLGRVIAAGRALHGGNEDAQGVHLLIDPRSENASLDMWSDPDGRPSWQAGASRALAILSEQSLFDDLRRIEKDNSRLEWARAPRGPARGGPRRGCGSRFAGVHHEVESERKGMRADEPHRDGERADQEAGELAGLLRRALLRGRRARGQGADRDRRDLTLAARGRRRRCWQPARGRVHGGLRRLPQPRPACQRLRARLRERDRVARPRPACVRARGRGHRWHAVVRPSQAPLRPRQDPQRRGRALRSIPRRPPPARAPRRPPRPGAGRRSARSSFAHTRSPRARDRTCRARAAAVGAPARPRDQAPGRARSEYISGSRGAPSGWR